MYFCYSNSVGDFLLAKNRHFIYAAKLFYKTIYYCYYFSNNFNNIFIILKFWRLFISRLLV
jgi:hypothetical protein